MTDIHIPPDVRQITTHVTTASEPTALQMVKRGFFFSLGVYLFIVSALAGVYLGRVLGELFK